MDGDRQQLNFDRARVLEELERRRRELDEEVSRRLAARWARRVASVKELAGRCASAERGGLFVYRPTERELEGLELSLVELCVLGVVLGAHVRGHAGAQVSIAELAAFARCSPRLVHYVLDRLEAARLLAPRVHTSRELVKPWTPSGAQAAKRHGVRTYTQVRDKNVYVLGPTALVKFAELVRRRQGLQTVKRGLYKATRSAERRSTQVQGLQGYEGVQSLSEPKKGSDTAIIASSARSDGASCLSSENGARAVPGTPRDFDHERDAAERWLGPVAKSRIGLKAGGLA